MRLLLSLSDMNEADRNELSNSALLLRMLAFSYKIQ